MNRSSTVVKWTVHGELDRCSGDFDQSTSPDHSDLTPIFQEGTDLREPPVGEVRHEARRTWSQTPERQPITGTLVFMLWIHYNNIIAKPFIVCLLCAEQGRMLNAAHALPHKSMPQSWQGPFSTPVFIGGGTELWKGQELCVRWCSETGESRVWL